MEPPREVQIEREGLLERLAGAYQRRDLDVFREAVRPDMVLTLTGSSRLAGTYHGYGAFAEYLEALRDVLRSAEKRIHFTHEGSEMVFRQMVIVSGPRHEAEMELVVTVRFHYQDGRVESFHVEPQDQGLFDHVIDSSMQPSEARSPG